MSRTWLFKVEEASGEDVLSLLKVSSAKLFNSELLFYEGQAYLCQIAWKMCLASCSVTQSCPTLWDSTDCA